MEIKNYWFAILLLLIFSCNRDKTIVEQPPEQKQEITNIILFGNNCKSFERLIKGSKMEDLMAVKQTVDGGYILCGSTETIAANQYDILIIKTDCYGNSEWMKTISNNFTDLSFDITPISTGGYILSAISSTVPNSFPIISYQGQLIKLNKSGNIIWKKTCNVGNSTFLYKVIEASDGGFTICGTDNTLGGFILKTDSSANQTWIKKFGDSIKVYDISIKNKNYVVCGSVSINQQDDIFLSEINQLGETVWTKNIDKNKISNEAYSILTLSNNDIIISGYNRTSGTNLPGFAMRLNTIGNEIWYKSLELEGINFLGDIVSLSDNEILSVGSKPNALTFVKFNSNNGSIIWTLDKSSNAIINDLQLTTDGGFILVGNLFHSANNIDGYILKTNQNGN